MTQIDKSKLNCRAEIKGFTVIDLFPDKQTWDLTIYNEAEQVICSVVTRSFKEISEICQLFGIDVTYEQPKTNN